MNQTDRAIIGGLVLVLVLVAGAIAGPALGPSATAPSPSAAPSGAVPQVPYREGILGRPVAVNPLAARSQVDRDLVSLAFGSLVRLGPAGQALPDLARSWSMSDDGASWTFQLRPDARWHDGQPLTADDVVFTVQVLTDSDYRGPGSGSWQGVTATAVGPRTVQFTLQAPIAAFLDLATQPIAPRHLLGDTPPGAMADDPFGEAPIGSGPYAISELDRRHAVLEPAPVGGTAPLDPSASGAPSGGPTRDPLTTPRPTPRSNVATPSLTRLEFRFFDTAAELGDAFRKGELDVASGLANVDAADLAKTPGARLLRYPATTLTAVALNLRPSHPEFANSAVRSALLTAIDRDAAIKSAFGGLAGQAESVIPGSSWAFDSAASPGVSYDKAAALKALAAAKWIKGNAGWRLPGTTAALQIELLVPAVAKNPALNAVGKQVAANWTALGLKVKLVEQDPATLTTDRLRPGEFAAAVVDIAIGHDPDLYPLLASTQTRSGGANVIGLQDPGLDKLLEAARQPGDEAARKAAFAALQVRLAAGRYLLPIAFADEVAVVRERVQGPAVREVADGSERFGDVLTWRLANDR